MLFIAMPCHGKPEPETMWSWGEMLVDLTRRGIPFIKEMVKGDPSIDRARATLAASFLRSKADRTLLIDADMMWTPEDVHTLLACDADVVGGAYSKKGPSGGVVGVPIAGAVGPLLECDRLGTGFLALSRDCLERMVTAYPETMYRAEASAGGGVAHNLFGQHISASGYFMQDDWSFCSRWKAIDGRIFMHTGVRPGHIGSHVYTLPEAPHV